MINKSKMYTILISVMLAAIFIVHDGFSDNFISNVAKGTYIPNDPVGTHNLQTLIIPSSNNDYAFFQSIGTRSSIVIGNFKADKKFITLIQDENSDGKVDLVVHWYPETKVYMKEKEPDKYCTADQFKKMKEEIIKGKYNSDNPFSDSLVLLDDILKDSSNISRSNNGYRVVFMTSDKPIQERAIIYLSNNGIKGNDLIFEHNFYAVGPNKIKPIIKWIIYCKDSKDPYLGELVKELYAKVSKNFPGNR